jgi:hypothetical protein
VVIDDDDIDAERARLRSGSMLVVPQSTADQQRRAARGERTHASTFGP